MISAILANPVDTADSILYYDHVNESYQNTINVIKQTGFQPKSDREKAFYNLAFRQNYSELEVFGDASIDAIEWAIQSADYRLDAISLLLKIIKKTKNQRGIEILRPYMKKNDYVFRFFCELRDPEAGKCLYDYLNSEWGERRTFASEILKEWKPREFSDQERINFLIATKDWEQLTQEEKKVVPYLINAINFCDGDSVIKIARLLGKIGDVRAIPALVKFLSHEKIAYEITSVLSLFGSATVIPLVYNKELFIKKVNYENEVLNETVDTYTRNIFMDLGESAIEPLIKILRSEPNPRLRQRVVYYLGNIKNQRTVAELINLTKSEKDCSVLAQTISLMSNIGDRSAIKPLIDLLAKEIVNNHLYSNKSSFYYQKEKLIDILGSFGDPAATDILLKNLVLEDQTLEKTIISLGKIKDQKSIPYLKKYYHSKSSSISKSAKNALLELGYDPLKIKWYDPRKYF